MTIKELNALEAVLNSYLSPALTDIILRSVEVIAEVTKGAEEHD